MGVVAGVVAGDMNVISFTFRTSSMLSGHFSARE